jgi:hypothetical protein
MFDNAVNGGYTYQRIESRPSEALECDLPCIGEDGLLGKEDLKIGKNSFLTGKLQCILANLKDGEGNPYYDDEINCIYIVTTEEAVRRFRSEYEEDPPGVADVGMLTVLKGRFLDTWNNCEDFFTNCHGEVFWADEHPSRQEAFDFLEKAVVGNIRDYTKGSFRFMNVKADLPDFSEIELQEKEDNLYLASSDEEITLQKVFEQPLGKEKIKVEEDFAISRKYEKAYLDLYDKSREIYDRIKSGYSCSGLGEPDILVDEEMEDQYKIFVAYQDREEPCQALIFIQVVDTSKLYNVYNLLGQNAMEYLTMEFYVTLT